MDLCNFHVEYECPRDKSVGGGGIIVNTYYNHETYELELDIQDQEGIVTKIPFRRVINMWPLNSYLNDQSNAA